MRKRYFTLIEMLVVIAIIIILAGMVLAGIQVVKKKQAQVLTVTYMKQLEVAIGQYQQIYSVLPFTLEQGTDDDFLIDDNAYTSAGRAWDGKKGINVLLMTLGATGLEGVTDADAVDLNPRKQKFLELDAKDEYLDAWGNDYIVVLDLTYDDRIADAVVYGEGQLKRNIAIWSKGRDGAHSATDSDSTNDDNMQSWSN